MTVLKNRARRHPSGTAERQSRRRQAADDEPLSHADKARGVSPNKYRLFRAVNPPEKVVNRYTDIISDTR